MYMTLRARFHLFAQKYDWVSYDKSLVNRIVKEYRNPRKSNGLNWKTQIFFFLWFFILCTYMNFFLLFQREFPFVVDVRRKDMMTSFGSVTTLPYV